MVGNSNIIRLVLIDHSPLHPAWNLAPFAIPGTVRMAPRYCSIGPIGSKADYLVALTFHELSEVVGSIALNYVLTKFES